MKIAFVVNSYPPRVGGLEYHIHDLVHTLADRGHDILVVTLDRPASEHIEGSIRVITLTSHLPIANVITFPAPGTTRRLTRLLRVENIDAVSVHTRFFPMTHVGLRAARKARIPAIMTEHGAGHVVSSSPIISLGARLVDITLGRRAMRQADQLLAVSQQAAQFTQKLSGRRGQVFLNAVKTPHLDVLPEPRPKHLVFVGRIVEGKGWDTFLTVVEQLRRRHHDVTGELLGDGPELDSARAEVARRGLGDIVTLRGRVDPDDVYDALAGSTLVNPSLLAEGFQTTLLEAVVCGGQVVTYDVPSALLLEQEDAPVRVCRSRTVNELIEAAEQAILQPSHQLTLEETSRWTWPVRAREYEDILSAAVYASRA